MGYSLRKKTRRPKTSEEFFEGITPEEQDRDVSNIQDLSSSSEEVSRPSPTNRMVYRGTFEEYNPNLPPAAFPTIDCHSQIMTDENPLEASASSATFGQGSIQQGQIHMQNSSIPYMSPGCSSEGATQPQVIASMTDKNHGNGEGEKKSSVRPKSRSEEESADWSSELNTEYMFELDMETSEDEDRPASKSVTKASTVPTWSGLTDAHKLNLLDTMAQIEPRGKDQEEDDYLERIMIRLRLRSPERHRAKDLLWRRQCRKNQERRSVRHVQWETHEYLTDGSNGRRLNAEGYRAILDKNFDYLLGQDDYHQFSTRAEEGAARAYWIICGFDSNLLDGEWAPPTVNDAPPILDRGSPGTSTASSPIPSTKQKIPKDSWVPPRKSVGLSNPRLAPGQGYVAKPSNLGQSISSGCSTGTPNQEGSSIYHPIQVDKNPTSWPSQRPRVPQPSVLPNNIAASATQTTTQPGIGPRSFRNELQGHHFRDDSSANSPVKSSLLGPVPLPRPAGSQMTSNDPIVSQADHLNTSFRQAHAPQINQSTPGPLPVSSIPESFYSHPNVPEDSQPSVLLPTPVPSPPEQLNQPNVSTVGNTFHKHNLNGRIEAISSYRDHTPAPVTPEKRPNDAGGDGGRLSPAKRHTSERTGGVHAEENEDCTALQFSNEGKLEKMNDKRGRPKKSQKDTSSPMVNGM